MCSGVLLKYCENPMLQIYNVVYCLSLVLIHSNMRIFILIATTVFSLGVIGCSPKGAAGTSTDNSSSATTAADSKYNAAPGNTSTRTLSNGREMKVRTLPQQQTMQKSR